jgi:methionine sulfoxide reductase heme-binding subunit
MDTALWVLGRGTGVAAVLLLTAAVVLGLLTRSGRPVAGLQRFAVQLVHRDVALTATVFVAVHVVTLLADTQSELRLVDVVVPFTGTYRWFWLGLGTLGVDLLIAVVVTALLRRTIGPRAFRAVHFAVYGLWPIALAHAVGAGTDGTAPWFLVIAACCVVAVVATVVWRAVSGRRATSTPRVGGPRTGVVPRPDVPATREVVR